MPLLPGAMCSPGNACPYLPILIQSPYPFPKYNLEIDQSQRDIMAYWDLIRYSLTDQDD